MQNLTKIRDNPLAYKALGCAMKVHNTLGFGFLEPIYQEALGIKLEKNHIPFEREKVIHVFFEGEMLKTYYKADFVCEDKLILELKATSGLTKEDVAQTVNYMKATGIQYALLMNFGRSELQYQYLTKEYFDALREKMN